jgi:very-short-patch-repair endonuclease
MPRYYRRQIDPSKFQKAYEMRHNPTPAEERMWEILKYEVMPHFPNHIFRRQWVAYGYIIDFYCPTLRLGLEIDGDIHDSQREYDMDRDSNLARRGISVLRARNEDVFNNPQTLVMQISQTMQARDKEQTSGCFIATAAYGTPFALEIRTLRSFRDNFMTTNSLGKKLVALYYSLSPFIANAIRPNPKLRKIARTLLNPIVRAFQKT